MTEPRAPKYTYTPLQLATHTKACHACGLTIDAGNPCRYATNDGRSGWMVHAECEL
jgi:hypothetical protein